MKLATEFVNTDLLINESVANLTRYGLSLPIKPTTVHSWMIHCGCVHGGAQRGYYVDNHEKPDVIKYRIAYLAREHEHELRMPLWVSLRKDKADELREMMAVDGGVLPVGHEFCGVDRLTGHDAKRTNSRR